MKVIGKQIYHFDEVEFNPIEGRLKRDGQEFYLRQKLLHLLLYLIEQRHRVVTKAELIDNVWEGLAITDDALIQSIKEVRKALGDDFRQPRFIKTIPKTGYRFIATIATIEETSYPDLGHKSIEQRSAIEVGYEETSENGSAVTLDTPAALPAPSTPTASLPRRHPYLIAAGFIIITILPLLYLGLSYVRRPQPLTEVKLLPTPGKRAIAVLFFNNQSGSTDLDWLREGLADMLITNLSRSQKFNVLGRQQLHLLLERQGFAQSATLRLDDALELGRKSQVEVVMMGSFARFGERMRINVQLYNTQNGALLASESSTADKLDEIINQTDLLSLKMAKHLGGDAISNSTPLASVMTDNLEAYRYYSLALEQIQMFQVSEAVKLLEKAIALDPQFAMAYGRIGYVYAVRWRQNDKAKPYLERAFALSSRLTEKDKLYITAWYAQANYDTATAIATYQQMINQYRLEVEAYQRLSALLSNQLRYDEAIFTIKSGLNIDPEWKALYNQLGQVYSFNYRYEEAVAAYQRYIQLAPNDPNALDSLGLCYQSFGYYDEAIATYQRALSINPEFEVALFHLGNAYFQQGRYRQALERYQRILAIASNDSIRARSYACIAEVYLKSGKLDEAEAAGRQSVNYYRRWNSKMHNLFWILLQVAVARGNHKEIERYAQAYAASLNYADSAMAGFLRFYHQELGTLSLKSGHSAEAIEHLQAAVKYQHTYWNINPLEDCLANAYLELNRFDEAIAEYQRILSLNPKYPLAHYHLAQAYERKGEKEKARELYARFLEVWPQADADIPEVIAAKQRVKS